MRITPAEAAKLLKKLNEDKERLLIGEDAKATFNCAMGEDVESIRPNYSYDEFQEEIAELDNKVIKLKHAINEFNINKTLPGSDMTIDMVLIYIPQLTARKNKLKEMSLRLKKERAEVINFGKTSTIIDYTYANYDVEKAKNDFDNVSDELSRLQTALDLFNSTCQMEVDI